VLVGVHMTAKTLTIRVEDNGVGIDPQVTPGRRNTAARARASGGHATVVRRSEPGTTFTWVALPLEGKWELITDAAGGKPCSLRPFSSGAAATGRTDCGPDPVDCRPLSRPNPPLPQWEQQPSRGG
jgi:hypothetical protein